MPTRMVHGAVSRVTHSSSSGILGRTQSRPSSPTSHFDNDTDPYHAAHDQIIPTTEVEPSSHSDQNGGGEQVGIQPKSSSEYNRTPRSSRDPGGRRTQIEQIFYSNRNGGTGNSLGHGRGPRRNQRSREPGIDPKRVDLPLLRETVVLQIVDYDRTSAQFRVITNEFSTDELSAYLNEPREQHSKRWIHVNGLSWDMLKILFIKYNIHPLAIEDVLHSGTSSSRSKSDYYSNHLFVSLVLHSSVETSPTSPHPQRQSSDTHSSRPSSPSSSMGAFLNRQNHHSTFDQEAAIESNGGVRDNDTASVVSDDEAEEESYQRYCQRLNEAFDRNRRNKEVEDQEKMDCVIDEKEREKDANRRAARHTVDTLTKHVKIPIHVERLSIIVLRCGTVISIAQDAVQHPRISSIFDRIHVPDGLLRSSEDPSMILQALLDAEGDSLLHIVEEFRDELTVLEGKVLSKPAMSTVRHLHSLSSQLLLLKSTISPLQALIQSLRYSDEAKATFAFKPSPSASEIKKAGFLSHEAKIYCTDVLDHVESVIISIDLFSSICQSLIDYTFNLLSFQATNYMQALSVVSIIFIPLTFLSGYFGMNFQTFPHVLDGDVGYFWQIAIPVTAATVFLFGFDYLKELLESSKREFMRLNHRRQFKRHLIE